MLFCPLVFPPLIYPPGIYIYIYSPPSCISYTHRHLLWLVCVMQRIALHGCWQDNVTLMHLKLHMYVCIGVSTYICLYVCVCVCVCLSCSSPSPLSLSVYTCLRTSTCILAHTTHKIPLYTHIQKHTKTQVSREVKPAMFDRIADAYLHFLVDNKQYTQAAALAPQLLRV